MYERVENPAAMKAALEARAWDFIISDYSMPQFGGMAAFELYREVGVDIPFISVSGTLGEDNAVEMMKAGAHDYVLKGNLARLVPAVERELRMTRTRGERKRAEEAASFLAAIVESSDDAIIGTTLEGIVLSWNRGAERIYGYPALDVIGRSISVIIPPYRPDELSQNLESIKRGQPVERYDTVRIRKDGKAVDISLTISPIKDREGRIIGVSNIARNITERRRQENERLQLIEELTDALSHVRTLSGLLPICATCKKIRDDQGYWQQLEIYIKDRSDADFTHGICPDCLKEAERETKGERYGLNE
jgi:PAS domain S-box-containing protein